MEILSGASDRPVAAVKTAAGEWVFGQKIHGYQVSQVKDLNRRVQRKGEAW